MTRNQSVSPDPHIGSEAELSADDHVDLATEAVQQGDASAASRHFVAALELGYDDLDDRAYLQAFAGEALVLDRQHTRAEPLLEMAHPRLLALGEHGLAALTAYYLGEIRLERGDHTAAVDWLEAADQSSGRGDELDLVAERIDLALAFGYHVVGRLAEAVQRSRSAEEGLQRAVRRRTGPEEIRELARSLVDVADERLAVASLDQGQALLGQDWSQAAALLQVAADRLPRFDQPARLGRAYQGLAAVAGDGSSDFPRAVQLYRAALACYVEAGDDDAFDHAQIWLIRALQMSGRLGEAEALLAEALARHGKTATDRSLALLTTLATIAEERGSVEEARRYLRSVSDRNAGDPRFLLSELATILSGADTPDARRIHELHRRAETSGDPTVIFLCDFAEVAVAPNAADSLRRIEALEANAGSLTSGLAINIAPIMVNTAKMQHSLRFGEGKVELCDGLAEQARLMLHLGHPRLAARAEALIARILLDAGRSEEALAHAIGSSTALDQARFLIRAADQRDTWSGVASAASHLALRAAAGMNDQRLIAELILTAQAAGLPTITDADPYHRADFLADSQIVVFEALTRASTVVGASRRFQAESAVELAPPPRVRMPWGTLALEAFDEQIDRLAETPAVVDVVGLVVAIR